MKKQLNPTIKAHLIRSAFYVLLLVAVCVIPFALAQRKTAKQSLTKPGVAQNGAKQAVTQRAMTAGPVAPPRVIAPRQRMVPPSSGAAPSRGHVIDWSNYPTFPNSSIRKLSEAPPRRFSSRPSGIGCTSYNFTLGTDTFVPGVTDLGLNCDDCTVATSLPFPVNLYDQSFTSVN